MNAKDKDGHTARSLAFKNNHVKTVTLLDNASYIYRRMSCEPGGHRGSEEFHLGGRGANDILNVELHVHVHVHVVTVDAILPKLSSNSTCIFLYKCKINCE